MNFSSHRNNYVDFNCAWSVPFYWIRSWIENYFNENSRGQETNYKQNFRNIWYAAGFRKQCQRNQKEWFDDDRSHKKKRNCNENLILGNRAINEMLSSLNTEMSLIYYIVIWIGNWFRTSLLKFYLSSSFYNWIVELCWIEQ